MTHPAYSAPALTHFGSISALTNGTVQVSDPGAGTQSTDPYCPDYGLWIDTNAGSFVSGAAPYPGQDYICYVPYYP